MSVVQPANGCTQPFVARTPLTSEVIMKRVVMMVVPVLMLSGLAAVSAAVTQRDGPYYRPTVVLQLGVSDLDKSIAFYEQVLGFKTVERRDDLKFAHVETNVPGLQLGLSAGSTLKGTGAAIVNISVLDVAASRKLLESRGVVFTGPTQVIPGKVALAAFRDPDGNQLRLAGPPPDRR
jgi:catechol 2,3-dioxygenase-like lactoylglutathione lyase family enzyme